MAREHIYPVQADLDRGQHDSTWALCGRLEKVHRMHREDSQELETDHRPPDLCRSCWKSLTSRDRATARGTATRSKK